VIAESLDLHTTAKADFLERFTSLVLRPRGLGDHVVPFPERPERSRSRPP
jgi:diaminobutyrate-2-oxoglutarate transaminase